MDDIALVSAMAGGDRNAFSSLYDRYCGVMLAVAQRILGQRREAEDLLHDVFLEVWRRAGTYDRARGTVKTWLLVRMRSRAIDRRRSARMTKQVLLDDCRRLADKPSGEDPSLAPDRQRVRKALDELPDEQRTVVILSYFEGLSSSEVAERIGVPIGTVKSRVAAARSKLKVILVRGAG